MSLSEQLESHSPARKRSSSSPAAIRVAKTSKSSKAPSSPAVASSTSGGVVPQREAQATGPTLASSNKKAIDRLYDNSKTRLGTLVAHASEQLLSSPSWEHFVQTQHGPPHIQPGVELLPHGAATYLAGLRDHGAPVLVQGPQWTSEQRDEAILRGCHPSAKLHRDFIAEEMCGFVDDGFWVVLPYHLVKDLPNLRLAPTQIKVERDRKPRFLVDHTFYKVNEETLRCSAPEEAMQFGGALHRILHAIRHADPAHGPVYLAKYDMKDGFYKIHTRADQCPSLGAILPRYEDLPPLVAIPLVLTMGWTNSPPTFCGLTETLCDLMNQRLHSTNTQPHRLESLIEAPKTDDLVVQPGLTAPAC